MQYLINICHDDFFTPTESLIKEIVTGSKKWKARESECTETPGDAKTVRLREGKVAVTKGPFAESKEKMCAYELIKCSSYEAATVVTSQHPMAKTATIEVRPIWDELAGWQMHTG